MNDQRCVQVSLIVSPEDRDALDRQLKWLCSLAPNPCLTLSKTLREIIDQFDKAQK